MWGYFYFKEAATALSTNFSDRHLSQHTVLASFVCDQC